MSSAPYLAAVQPAIYHIIFAVFSFILGAAIGSFLNVCIYRMPRNLSVNNPRRSFCPSCNYQIPLRRNIPLFSWLLLRGKCANCGARIPFRYFGVELLTALLFLAVWLHVWPQNWVLAFPYWILVSLFIVATFIDFEHFIIPDEITIGGTVAGVVLSFGIPKMMGETSPLMSGLWSLVGAAAGYALLRAVVELGKLAFGKKRRAYKEKQAFRWVRREDEADMEVGEEKTAWMDHFYRETDRMLATMPWIDVDGERFENVVPEFKYEWLQIGDRKWELGKTNVITGEVTEITFPQEAMGLGDVKFIACIGAFLGWKAVLFTVMAASVVGAIVGVTTIALGHREWSAKIPFGPYLALGALIWMFRGPQLVAWYWQLAGPTQY